MNYPADLPNIAFIGKAGAGKTTASRLLMQRFDLGYLTYSFAAPLKDIAAHLWGEDARTARDPLQRLGVAVRDIEPDTWVNLLLKTVDDAAATTMRRACVDDCRFPNELEALATRGWKTIRVSAPVTTRIARLKGNGKLTDPSQLLHESETALDDYQADYRIVNDGAWEDDLAMELANVLNHMRV